MRVKRGSNIDSLLARKLGDRGDPWTVEDRGKHGSVMSYGGEQYNTEGEEGRNFLNAVDRYYSGDAWSGEEGGATDREIERLRKEAEKRLKKGQEASMADFGDEEGGGFYNEAMGLLDSDSIGTEKKTYRDVDTEGDNRYLNKLAREEFAEKQMDRYDDDLGFAENQKDISRFMGPKYESGATWRSESDENALDALARTEPERLKAERAKEIGMADSGMMGGEEEGSWSDKFKGLFASDSIGRDESLEQETKDNEALGGKIAAAGKLYSMFKPEQQQAAPATPTSRVTRGSVAFPGMQLASQKQRRKYFTPKGLMA